MRRSGSLPRSAPGASKDPGAVDWNEAGSAVKSTEASAGVVFGEVSGIMGEPFPEIAAALAELERAELPASLGKIEASLCSWKTGYVDKRLVVELLNEVRYFALHDKSGGVPSIDKLAKHITPAHLERLYHASHVLEGHLEGRRGAAGKKGIRVPKASTEYNLLNYEGVPPATEMIEDPWYNSLVKVVVAALQPLYVSKRQSSVIGRLDYYVRLEHPDVKTDKSVINFSATQSEIKADIRKSVEVALKSSKIVVNLFKQYGFVDHSEKIDLDKFLTAQLLPAQRSQLIKACQDHATNMMALNSNASRMHAVDGAHKGDRVSTTRQILSRTLRNLGPVLAAFFREPGPQTPRSFIGDLSSFKLSHWVLTGITMGISAGALAYQHWEAGNDEKNRQEFDDKLFLLLADVIEEDRKASVNFRGTITEGDIDEKKFKKLIVPPAVMVVDRTRAQLEDQLGELSNQLAGQQSTQAGPLAVEEGIAGGDPELQKKIDHYQRDLTILCNLTDVNIPHDRNEVMRALKDLHEDTVALLEAAQNGSKHFAEQERRLKAKSPGEFSVQFSMRIAQFLMLIFLGGLGALAGSSMVTAVFGGNRKMAADKQLGVALVGIFLGLFAAWAQPLANNVKNQARDSKSGDHPMGFWKQTLYGAGAPLLYANNTLQSAAGRKVAGDAFNRLRKPAVEIFAFLEALSEMNADDNIGTSDDAPIADSDPIEELGPDVSVSAGPDDRPAPVPPTMKEMPLGTA